MTDLLESADVLIPSTDASQRQLSAPTAGQKFGTSNLQGNQSDYLVNRLFETSHHTLFNHVKFNLVAHRIKQLRLPAPKILDIGCGLQVARTYLTELGTQIDYFGADYEAAFSPDAVVDLNRPGTLSEPMRWNPDVVMLLDVLEHLHEEKHQIADTLSALHKAMPASSMVLITLPQMYRLDRFKLPHLHYPEHKIRLTQKEWLELLEVQFEIMDTQGVGYLSVLPYLPMASRRYQPDNFLGRLFNRLRNQTFEARWLKPVDLFLSNTVGRIGWAKRWSNDFLVVARPRR